MTDEEILEIAKKTFVLEYHQGKFRGVTFRGNQKHILNFARVIIEEHEKDREHNLSKDEYFNSWKN